MVRIWRIEHSSDGFGPFSTLALDDLPESLVNRINATGHHPTPFSEKLGFRIGIDRCGFKTVRQMTGWFHKGLIRDMVAEGFVIVTYDVPEIRCGQAQAVFDVYTAKNRCVRGLDVLRYVR